MDEKKGAGHGHHPSANEVENPAEILSNRVPNHAL
jgi:hypothetical protein